MATTLMTARRVVKARKAGVPVQTIAEREGITRRTVTRLLGDKGLKQQRAYADRCEAFLGGVLGPGDGNYRTMIVTYGESQIDKTAWPLGISELTSPDPCAILIAHETVQEEGDSHGD